MKSTVEFALRELIRAHAMRELADLRIDIEDTRGPGYEPSRRSAPSR